jgi:hypothetical protein
VDELDQIPSLTKSRPTLPTMAMVHAFRDLHATVSTMFFSTMRDGLYPGLVDDLPELTADQLQQCREHRTVPLSACVNIANPATGSSSLEKRFLIHPALANYTNRPRRALFHVGFVRGKIPLNLMHSHVFGVEEFRRFMRRKRLPEPPCYVMTVRDPAERLESAFRRAAAAQSVSRLAGLVGSSDIRGTRLRISFVSHSYPIASHRLACHPNSFHLHVIVVLVIFMNRVPAYKSVPSARAHHQP